MNIFHRAAEIASERDLPMWRCLKLTGETPPADQPSATSTLVLREP